MISSTDGRTDGQTVLCLIKSVAQLTLNSNINITSE